MLHKIRPAGILQEIVEKNIPLNMSSFCSGRWQQSRTVVTELREDTFDVKVSPRKKSRPITLKADQVVGISFRYEYGEDTFIFDTKVVAVKSATVEGIENQRIILAVPEQIELVKKSSFLRVQVPASLDVNVQLWHRSYPGVQGPASAEVCHGWEGKLVDISAGGLQVAIDKATGPALEEEQFLGLRFIPLTYQAPLRFNAYVRNVWRNADEGNVLVGLEMVGLEASPEGRLILQRLCDVVEQYRQLNKAGLKQKN